MACWMKSQLVHYAVPVYLSNLISDFSLVMFNTSATLTIVVSRTTVLFHAVIHLPRPFLQTRMPSPLFLIFSSLPAPWHTSLKSYLISSRILSSTCVYGSIKSYSYTVHLGNYGSFLVVDCIDVRSWSVISFRLAPYLFTFLPLDVGSLQLITEYILGKQINSKLLIFYSYSCILSRVLYFIFENLALTENIVMKSDVKKKMISHCPEWQLL